MIRDDLEEGYITGMKKVAMSFKNFELFKQLSLGALVLSDAALHRLIPKGLPKVIESKIMSRIELNPMELRLFRSLYKGMN